MGSVTGNVGGSVASVTGTVTVGTNNDKTGYALTSAEHTNIASDAATGILITPANKLLTDSSGDVSISVASPIVSNVTQINGSSSAAVNLAYASGSLAYGSVSSTSFSPTTTQFDTTITTSLLNSWVNRWIRFTSGVLINSESLINAYQLVGSNGRFTVSALPGTPSAGDAFIIV